MSDQLYFIGSTQMIGNYLNSRLLNLALVLPIALLPVACNKEDSKDHLQKGVEYFKQGDYEKAKLELKTSNQSDKNTAETYYYLALLDEKNHQYKAMRENLGKVIELQPNNTQARLKLGKLLLLFNEPQAAQDQAEFILKQDGQNLEALTLKASVFAKNKKFTETLGIIETVLQKNPKFIEAMSLKALVFSEQNQVDKALALLNEAMQVDPKNIELHFFKIQLHAKTNDIPAIVSEYQQLTDLYPENQDYVLILSRLYAQRGQYAEGEQLIRKLVEKNSTAIQPNLMLLEYLSEFSPGKIPADLQKISEQYKDGPRRLLDLALWTISKRKFADAKKLLEQVIDLEKDSLVGLNAKTLLAQIAFEEKDFVETEKLIDEILDDNSNYNDAKVLRSRLFLVNKQYDQALEILNKVLMHQPELESALQLSAQTYLSLGDRKKANEFFENTLKVNPINPTALDYLYNKAVAENDIAKAKEMVAIAGKYQPNNLDLLEKMATISLLEHDIASAKSVVQKIKESLNPLAADLTKILLARIAQAEGNYAQALAAYKDILNKFPGNKQILDSLAACYDKLNQPGEMLVVLKGLRQNHPNNVNINFLLANLLLKNNKIDEGISLINSIFDGNKKNPQIHTLLAKFKVAQGDTQGAISTLQEGLQQIPDSTNLSLHLAELYQQQQKYDLAVAVYEQMLSKNPQLDVASNNLATLLIEHYNDPKMLDKAIQLTQHFKDSEQPYYKDTYAWALIKQGKAIDSIPILQEVITSVPDVPIFRYHLGIAYTNVDNVGNAIAELQQAIELANKKPFPEQGEAEQLVEMLVSKTRGH